jgi:hypothetical protein
MRRARCRIGNRSTLRRTIMLVRFNREFTKRLDVNKAKTWPQGWSGELDDKIAAEAVKAGVAIDMTPKPEPKVDAKPKE